MQTISEMTLQKVVAVPSKSAEMRKLILKLRWIGMEEEADRLSDSLAQIAPTECLVMGPRDTD